MQGRRKRARALLAAAALAVALTLPAAPSHAQEIDGALLLIMDASGSMTRTDATGVPLIDGAKAALRRVVDDLPAGTPVGLRVYGHRQPNTVDPAVGCQDTELVVPVGPLDVGAMRAAIDGYQASGFTPIGLSLQQAAQDLPPEGPRTILLVTDGEDTCAPPDPCQVARDLVAQGIDVTIEAVGFFLQGNQAAIDQLTCIAEATGGSFREAADAGQLADQLSRLSTRALRSFEAEGEPVTGAPAAIEAPVLEPGTYTDTVLIDEALWYGVELAEGQELTATVTRADVPEIGDVPVPPYLQLAIADPAFAEFNSASDFGYARENGQVNAAHTVQIRSGRVGVEGGPPFNNDPGRPGTWYLRVLQESNVYVDELLGRELPIEITLEVQGEGQVSPSPSSSPTVAETPPAVTPDVTPTEEPEPVAQDEGGFPLAAVAIGLLGLLVLLLGFAVVVLLRRTRGLGGGPPPAAGP